MSGADEPNAGERRVIAAGGVVIRAGDRGAEVVAVHRPKYGDWSLPKGKLHEGESWEGAALREVAEETGLECELAEELSTSCYVDAKGRPKRVRWWLMHPRGGSFTADAEVDAMRWLAVDEADRVLDYEGDRALVREAVGRLGSACR